MFSSLSFSYRAEFRQESFKSLFNQHFYYQLTHVLYTQSYPISVYLLSSEWPSQDYNSYWKNKSNQASQPVSKLTDQPQLPAPKQPLMITAGAAATSEPQPAYSSFRQEANFHHGQGQYKCATRDQSQSFY